ncbi:MAG: hypothetical protein ACO1TE_22700 [Prosthecobacter sp.]
MDAASFPVGHKVVCIHDHFPPAVHEWFNAIPVEGQVYTIQEIFWAPEHATRRQLLSVRLVELPPVRPGFGGFSLWRFRLLEDEKILRARSRKEDLPERVLT